MGLCSCRLPALLKKVLMDKTKRVKKCGKKCHKKKTFLGHLKKSETGSESMCRSVMACSFQKWFLKSALA